MLGLLSMLADLIKNMTIKRIGMRYTNIIDTLSSFKDLSDLFHRDYIPTIPSVSLGNRPVNLINNAKLRTPEDYYIRIVYGLFNLDHPSIIGKYDYLFYIDCYLSSTVNPNEVTCFIKAFHDNIQHVFESAITNQLRSVMDEK